MVHTPQPAWTPAELPTGEPVLSAPDPDGGHHVLHFTDATWTHTPTAPTPTERNLVAVRIDNHYADTNSWHRIVEVPPPAGEPLEDWWQDSVFEHTGDERSTPGVGSYYAAAVLYSPTPTVPTGATCDWSD